MSAEVQTDAQPMIETAAVRQPAPSPSGPSPLWRRRGYQLAALVAVVALIAAFTANNLIAGQYTPDGAVRQYLAALQSGNAEAAWPLLQVGPAPQGVTASLVDAAAMRAALAAGRPDITSFTIDSTTSLDAATAKVGFTYDTKAGSQQSFFVVRHSGQTQFLLYQGWRVQLAPVVLQIPLPQGTNGVSIDGQHLALPAGTSTVAVLPVSHKVELTGTDLLAPQTLTIDAFGSAQPTVAFTPSLTSAGLNEAKAAITASFATCVLQSSGAPAGCPQTYTNTFAAGIQWQLVGDPTGDMAISFDKSLNLVATGHFLMVVGYHEDGVSGVQHDVSSGGYQAALNLGASDVRVTAMTSAAGLAPLQRPSGATDQAALQIVATSFTSCAGKAGMKPADCPQGLLSGVADNVHWKLSGDPTAGATVSWDPNSGILSVHGQFAMTASYTINGYRTSDPSYYTTYVAALVWNGQALQLVTIAGAFS